MVPLFYKFKAIYYDRSILENTTFTKIQDDYGTLKLKKCQTQTKYQNDYRTLNTLFSQQMLLNRIV